ncbi:MAG: malate:quinone oxidoreductase, partial [Brevibacterium sp.]
LPLMFEGRGPGQVNGISRTKVGSDVDFGSLSHQLLNYVGDKGATIRTSHQVTDLERSSDGWVVTVKDLLSHETHKVNAKFVFVGAGGGALPLLQKSGIPEGRG